MPTLPFVRQVSGFVQSAVGGTGAVAVLSEWSNAAGWVAVAEITIQGRGVSSGQVDAYYRREVFKWTAAAGNPVAVGALVAATILEEDAAWNAIVARNGNNVEVQVTGDATELVNWSWWGTITLQKVS